MTLNLPKRNDGRDAFGWNAGPDEISTREVNATLTGVEIARASFIEGRSRDRQLREQSEDIAQRLERVGIRARNERDAMTVVGLVSGQAEKATDFRNCNMFPYQQSRNVHDMMNHVRYFMDVSDPRQLRMLVVSGGWCRLDQYRKHHRAHTRRMSKFASHPYLAELGISVAYYNVENTIHRQDGAAMLNLHSHVLIRASRRLGKKTWLAFLAFARNHFPKGYVHDSRIEKAAEVVKYVFKPSEFDLLTDGELGELFAQVTGGRPKIDPLTGEVETRIDAAGNLVEVLEGPLKFFHPLGDLKKFRSGLRGQGQKLILVPTVDDRWIWRLTEKRPRAPRPEETSGRRENVVMAITRPLPKFTPRMEPCVIVTGYTGNFDRMVHENGLQAFVSEIRGIHANRVRRDREDAARRDSASMEHTTTTTVPAEFPETGRSHPPPFREPAPPSPRETLQ
tara:strand:+ start:795 stop:2147 length:1353 start_codon:yes stop_codon:yes gene_type:complete